MSKFSSKKYNLWILFCIGFMFLFIKFLEIFVVYDVYLALKYFSWKVVKLGYFCFKGYDLFCIFGNISKEIFDINCLIKIELLIN